MIEIIPAIGIISGGKCVRLTRGSTPPPKYIPTTRSTWQSVLSMPVAAVCILWTSMARRAIILSITTHCGWWHAHTTHHWFGGGLKAMILRIAFESGAAMVTGGSIAVRCPDTFLRWLDAYGPRPHVGAGCAAVKSPPRDGLRHPTVIRTVY